MADKKIIDYYENLYKNKDVGNPASRIYNKLRADAIAREITSATELLVVGCGNDEDLRLLEHRELAAAFDLAFHAVLDAKKTMPEGWFFVADATAIPLPKASFSTVACSEVLEHIPNFDAALGEIARVTSGSGSVILTTPNKISFFGMARWLGEKILHKRLASDDQPYDDWKSLDLLKASLSKDFIYERARGIWYLPPLHFRGKGLPAPLTKLVALLFLPFEMIASRLLPGWGHIVLVRGSRRANNLAGKT